MFGGLFSPRLDAAPPREAGRLLALARELTPRAESASPGLVVLDLHGLGRLWPSPEALGESLLASARRSGVDDARVAVAWTRTTAAIVARAREGLTLVPPGSEAAALAPLSLELLPLADGHRHLFRLWGLRTLGDLARLPAVGLSERLGREGPALRRLARGEDATPLVPTPADERFESTLEIDWPVDGLEPLSFLLLRVLESLCLALRQRGRSATALTVSLGLVDGTRHVRTLRPAAPSVDPRTWRTLIRLELEAHPPADAVQSIGVRAESTEARVVQFSLLDPAQPSPERLAETLGRLRSWTEAGRAGAPALLDTHRPGAFVVQTFSPPPYRGSRVRAPLWPRVVLRLFRPPRPAHVRLEAGAPAHVDARGVRGTVRERAGPWRASGDWWDVAWSREEWDVALADGAVYRLVLDRMKEEWLVEGVLD